MGNCGEENNHCNFSRRNISDSSGNCDSERLDCYSDDCVNGALGTTGQSEGDDEPYNNGGNVEISGSEGCDEDDEFYGESEGFNGSDVECIDNRGIDEDDYDG